MVEEFLNQIPYLETLAKFGIFDILGIIIGIILVVIVVISERNRRKRDENFYITVIMNDIRQLKEHLINIQDISECSNPIPSKEEQIEITQKLINYSERNKKFIELLISDTRLAMSRWMNLKDVEKNDVENFIKTTNWVLDDYLPKLDESKDTQRRRWSNYFEEFQERKNISSKKMDDLILKYT